MDVADLLVIGAWVVRLLGLRSLNFVLLVGEYLPLSLVLEVVVAIPHHERSLILFLK